MIKKVIYILIVITILISIYGLAKPLPEEINFKGDPININPDQIHFLSDITYTNSSGERFSEQEIFDEVISMINNADSYILMDFFLYNDFVGTETSSYRQLSSELTNALIEKKKENPDIIIQLITDPINQFYGGIKFDQFESLKENGIIVIETDLTKLRDSNPIYSGFWRTYLQWFGNNNEGGLLPNPLNAGGDKVTFRSYFSSLNFKANHRKLIVADYIKDGNRDYSVLITSANPHDGSSAHSNSAIKVDTLLWRDVIKTEKVIVESAGIDFIEPQEATSNQTNQSENTQIQLLTEEAIRDSMLESINNLQEGDSLDMAMFYIADRKIIKSLKKADKRGVQIRLLFDANKDAFGREKNGMPNRQVASEVLNNTNGNTEVRWCATNGEQCHSKLLILKSQDKYELFAGSANLTRRNIGGFNLETDVKVTSNTAIEPVNDAMEFFDKTWSNKDGKTYSTEYTSYADEGFFKKILYRIQEKIGTNRW